MNGKYLAVLQVIKGMHELSNYKLFNDKGMIDHKAAGEFVKKSPTTLPEDFEDIKKAARAQSKSAAKTVTSPEQRRMSLLE